MTETPPLLPETTGEASDLLSDLLASMRLSGTVLFHAAFSEPWCIGAPEACELARALAVPAERLISFHVIAGGGAWIGLPGRDRVWLEPGDAVLLPHGDHHFLSGHEAASVVPVDALLPAQPWSRLPRLEHGGPGQTTTMVCGFLQCDELIFQPVLRHLPKLVHVSPSRKNEDPWLASTIQHVAREATSPRPGARSILPRLTELMFVEILRAHMQGLSADEVGWFAAFNDPVAGAALRLLHGDPRRSWSVDELARQVGSSRTVLTERFNRTLALPPMQYLTQWRLQLAAQQLKLTKLPVKTVADQAGYESEAAFSRAFKRAFASAPADWRRRQEGEGSGG